jgi:hypothetical protein
MEQNFRYRGKTYSAAEIHFIRRLINEHPCDSRYALSKKLCIAWNWVQKNGAPCDQICRSLMLELDRAGHIKLPPRKMTPANHLANRQKPAEIIIDQTPIQTALSGLSPLIIREVRRDELEKTCNSLIEQFHYLGYTQPVGEHLKYLLFAGKRPIACMTWSSAPRHIGVRDKFIGWKKPVREKRLNYMAYNSRFLILPWVKVKFLASHILGLAARRISGDWMVRYNHPVYYLETFVDTERFYGTCYKAANWICLGDTTGRGKNDQTHKANRSIKAVYGYPLAKDFREKLCG